MMKSMLIALFFIVSIEAFPQAPKVQGHQSSSGVYSPNILVPNASATKISGTTSLIETGNGNILVNPSFEHSTVATGWTCTGITPIAETTVTNDGKQAIVLGASASTFECYQDSTINAAYNEGSNYVASMRVRVGASATGSLKVCARKNYVLQAALCSREIIGHSNGVYQEYDIQFTGDATSNGVSLVGTGVTGNIYSDNASLAQKTKVVGGTTSDPDTIVYGAGNSNQPITNAVTDIPFTEISDTGGAWNGSQFTVPETGIYSVNLRVAYTTVAQRAVDLYIGGAVDSRISDFISDNNHGAKIERSFTKGQVISFRSPVNSGTLSNSAYTHFISISKVGKSTPSSTFSSGAPYTIRVRGAGNGGTVVTAGTTNVPFTEIEDTASAWNGSEFTAPEDGEYKIDGGMIFTASTTGRYQAAYVDTGSGYAFAKSLSIRNGSSQDIAKFQGSVKLLKGHKLAIRAMDVTSTLLNTPIFHYLTIERVFDPQLITAEISGLAKCTDTFACTDTFTAKLNGATCAIESTNVPGWITSTSDTGPGDCLVNYSGLGLTSAPTGQLTVVWSGGTSTGSLVTPGPSTTTVRISAINSSGALADPVSYQLSITKTGADSVGQTVKAVASDQNVRSIGSIGMDIQSVYFGSGAGCSSACTTGSCTICHQVGAKVTSVTWAATGQYNINGIDGTKYSCAGTGYSSGGSGAMAVHSRGGSTSSLARINLHATSAVADSGYVSVTCVGIP